MRAFNSTITPRLERERAFARIEELFARAIELEESAVALFLEHEEKDEDLRREVAGLVAAHHLAGRFLEKPALEGHEPWADNDVFVGRRLGSWRLARRIGEGGMSSVYLGVREEGDFEQQVAVKLAHQGHGSRWLAARLAEERRFLSRLDHPGIARLLDGGATEEGVPYLVMELATGQPIDQYCIENELELEARLDLFLDALDAVDFAHRALIVHRDLKPAHVLVDAQGKIKLLDFGIAKLLDPEPFRASADLTRRSGVAAFTPSYASPEQLRGEPITTATDVYALGVVLYKVLTGALPRELASLNPADIAASFAADPPPPSRLGLIGGQGKEHARLPADLDAVTRKALAADPRERYPSAAAFAEDLRRLRGGYPVLARRATLLYRLQRALDRHRWAFALSLLALLALTGFLLHARQQAMVIENERNRAVEEKQRAEAVVYFLSGVLSNADPATGGKEISLREALDRGSAYLEQASTPKEKLVLLETLGPIYRSLGAHQQAKPLLEEGIRLAKETGEEVILAKLYFELGTMLGMSGHHPEAQALHVQAFELRRKYLPVGHPDLLASRDAMVRQLNWDFVTEEGLELEAETLATRRLHLGARHPETLLNQARFAKNLNLFDRLAEGCPLAEATRLAAAELDAADVRQSTPLFPILINLGDSRLLCGDVQGAVPIFEQALELAKAAPTVNPIRVNIAQSELANAKMALGEADNLAAELEPIVADTRRRLGEEAQMVVVLRANLAEAKRGQGQVSQAKAIYDELLELHPDDAGLHFQLGMTLLRMQRFAAAKIHFETSRTLRQRILPPGHSLLIETEGMLGFALIGLGQTQEGERRVREARMALIAKLGPHHPRVGYLDPAVIANGAF